MKHPNSDDTKKPHSQQSIKVNTLEAEDGILEQTDKRPAIVVPSKKPSVPLSKEVDAVSSSDTSDQFNGHEQAPLTSDSEKTVLPSPSPLTSDEPDAFSSDTSDQFNSHEQALSTSDAEKTVLLPPSPLTPDDPDTVFSSDTSDQPNGHEQAPLTSDSEKTVLPSPSPLTSDEPDAFSSDTSDQFNSHEQALSTSDAEKTVLLSPSPLTSDEPDTVSSDTSDQFNDHEQAPPISDAEKTVLLSPSPLMSDELDAVSSNSSDRLNAHEQNPETSDSEKTDSFARLVPLTAEVVYPSTQSLIPNATDKPVRQRSRSLVPQRGHTNLSNRPTRTLGPALSTVPSVRTPATLQMLKAQRHKRLLLRHLSRKHMRQSRAKEQRTSNRLWISIFTTVAIIFTFFLSITGGGAYAALSFYNDTESQYAAQILDLRNLMPGDNLKVYDRNGIFIGQDMEGGMKTSVPLDQISPYLINATIDTEDKGFWDNPGIDVTRIMQAAIENLRKNRVVEGGSTITQQLIKNLILTKDRNFQRKLQEVALVPDINNHYSKRDIMEMYLNSNNYGETTYGPEAAAMYYFGLEARDGKSAASQLNLAQAATLAGIPNLPSAYDPLLHPQAAFARLQVVLNAMMNNHHITLVQKLDALKEAQQPDFFKVSTHPGFANRAPHFYFFILNQLRQQVKQKNPQMTDKEIAEQVARSDMKVYTTLDITLQDRIQKIAQEQIAALAPLNVTNAAEVLIDFHTGAIISMLGSLDYYNKAKEGQVNVALAYRQPGSSFKPYVYVTAFADGISPGQGIADQPLTVRISDTEIFSPQNADGKTHGQMTIRCALQNSLNIPAVRTLQYVGIDKAMEMAHNMGITSYEGTPGLSLVLGGLGVRLLDHTSAFGTFANGGVHVPYYGIEKIVFASTNRVEPHKVDLGTRVLSPQLAYMMTNVLSDNVARTSEFTKCSVLYLYSNSQNDCYAGNPGTIRPAAAKTGTTNDFRDNWTMGYTTDYVMGVWSGNNDNSPMKVVYGVQGAAPIWHLAMLAAEEGRPIQDFPNPGGLQTATVTYPDGVRSTDLYIQGQDPYKAAINPANRILAPAGSGGFGARYCPNS